MSTRVIPSRVDGEGSPSDAPSHDLSAGDSSLTLGMTPFWNPYLAGIALGLVLLTAFLVMGHGLGASGAATRIGNFIATRDVTTLDDWLVFEVLGVLLGGILGAVT